MTNARTTGCRKIKNHITKQGPNTKLGPHKQLRQQQAMDKQ